MELELSLKRKYKAKLLDKSSIVFRGRKNNEMHQTQFYTSEHVRLCMTGHLAVTREHE